MKLLHIDSTALGGASVSRQLTAQVVAQWRATHPGAQVEYLDLVANAPSHLDADSLGFRLPPGAALSEAQRRENALSEALVSQFLAADVIVVGAPLYNFSVPSQLKAWIDRVAQAGRTFRYTEKGPQGLAHLVGAVPLHEADMPALARSHDLVEHVVLAGRDG